MRPLGHAQRFAKAFFRYVDQLRAALPHPDDNLRVELPLTATNGGVTPR